MDIDDKIECSACDFEQEKTTSECRTCYVTYCLECLTDKGECVPCG